ncbi:MAG: DUF3400 domain-containing protein [Candidatus Thiodiazotropha sp. (ex Dulcina madagascariensis)]|nr:DUF3400 domain-containing protein [Candidatus Thiodiazotropha sp. (ex Dulcina madagascariensis)]
MDVLICFQQGLSRYTDETVRRLLGEAWQQRFIDQVLRDGIELVLV